MRRLNQRGSSVVDYLMLTALVAGVVVPIIFTKFGAPLMKSMESEREKLVNFIGQTPRGRKPPVPSAWFSQKPPASAQSRQLGQPQELPPGAELSAPADLGQPGDLQAGNLGEVQSIKDPGTVQAGQVEGGGSGGAIGNRGAGDAGMSGGGDDFFADAPKVPGGGIRGEKGDEETAGSSRSRSGGGGESSGRMAGEDNLQGGQAPKGSDAKKGSENQAEGSKKRSLVEAEAELDERIQKKKFDWWLLIKVLIIIFIMALVFLIVMGNTRRNG